MIKTDFFHGFLQVLFALVVWQNTANAAGKTIYVHLLDGDDSTADGSYSHPFKSWRAALRRVTGGDTIVGGSSGKLFATSTALFQRLTSPLVGDDERLFNELTATLMLAPV